MRREEEHERPTSEDETAEEKTKTIDNSNGGKSEEEKNARELEFSTKAEPLSKDDITTRHIPGGAWLMQICLEEFHEHKCTQLSPILKGNSG
ncbi:hypothetical protein NDU88_006729 [Pleurodeles waltl]|uniref:Uncharacterized protein n=1 Tax=Pleurodeles waltl TaxID=8319 RepID=A0AAV7X3M0_PLEWA|nr:hypothetical protein NDU88_006729 [Pleurodeles waltl]